MGLNGVNRLGEWVRGFFLETGPSYTDLPAEILEIIISKLTSQEGGRTMVLSRQWEHLWKRTNTLNFEAPYTCSKSQIQKLVVAVHDFLSSRDRTVPFENIILRCPYEREHEADMNGWLASFLCRSLLRVLMLDFRALQVLETRIIRIPFDVCSGAALQNLKVLSLKGIFLTEGNVDFLLSSAPLVEELTLLDNLLISFPSVVPCKNLRKLHLSNPIKRFSPSKCHKLKSLMLCSDSGDVNAKEGTIKIDSFVQDLILGGRFADLFLDGRLQPQFNLISHSLTSLNLMVPKSIVTAEQINSLPVLGALVKLKIQTWNSATETRNFCLLLHRAPSLRSFTFQAGWEKLKMPIRVGEVDSSWYGERPPCQNLTEVNIKGYYGTQRDDEMVLFFLGVPDVRFKILIQPWNQAEVLDQLDSDFLRLGATDDGVRDQARRRVMNLIRGRRIPRRIKLVLL